MTRRKPKRPMLIAAIALVAVAVIGLLYWFFFSDPSSTVRREAPRVVTIVPLPPPPPPPPPKPPEPKPEEKVEEQLENPEPQPQEPQPQPAQQLTIDGPAQAGGDAFGIGAGSGGGMMGRGAANAFANASYGRYVEFEIKRAIESATGPRAPYRILIDLWIEAGGRIASFRLVRSSGDTDTDRLIEKALREMPALGTPPPPDMKFPQRFELGGQWSR